MEIEAFTLIKFFLLGAIIAFTSLSIFKADEQCSQDVIDSKLKQN